MRYGKLGKTGLKVSSIGFGAIKLPEISEGQACAALHRALDLGVNFIDTGRNYQDSEHKIGLVLKERRDECYVASKTIARDADGAMRDLETSLGELQTERLDLWQLHNVMDRGLWEQVTRPDGALAAAKRAHAEGLVDHIGISVHRSLYVMREAIHSGEFETILLLYNPLDEEGVAANGILDLAHERGIGVIIMKALSGGALALPLSNEERDEKYHASGGQWFDPIVRGSLRYVLSHPAVDVVIPGMRFVREVEENVLVGDMPPLTDAERDELVQAIGRLRSTYKYQQDCLGCGYCLSVCPQGIQIPQVFRAVYAYRHYLEETRHIGLEIYRSLEVSPEECIECEDCVEKCPAGIPIPQRLKEAVELFTGIQGG
jgi:predicted aldo/keto reductase-like oxidoreductase